MEHFKSSLFNKENVVKPPILGHYLRAFHGTQRIIAEYERCPPDGYVGSTLMRIAEDAGLSKWNDR
jgi:hypothetical protein